MVTDDQLGGWCVEHLRASVVRELFRTGHLSVVAGLELSDGRGVVVKAREWTARLSAVLDVQRTMHARGFPCPRPLAGPAPLGALVATAEEYVPPQDAPPTPPPARPAAELLARLVALAPPADEHPALDPAPPWVGWDHGARGLWPVPDDIAVDMNAHAGPSWIDDLARSISARLAHSTAPRVIGHVDWEAHNLDWSDGKPVLVHDWDSLAIRIDAAVAGVAAAVYPSDGRTAVAATVDQREQFLDAYRSFRPGWTSEHDAVAWAAGLWVLTYNAKKETLGGGGGYVDHLSREAGQRAGMAGL